MGDANGSGSGRTSISVFLADDNLIVREGVRALLGLDADIEVVGVAEDFDTLIAGADEFEPQVVVTDIRMPPSFHQEGIEAAKLIRLGHPGTGIVILSQFDDPEYATSLVGDGAAGYAYLLKDRVAEGDHLAAAVRTVAAGGSMLDPEIVAALVNPVSADGTLAAAEEALLQLVAQGKPIKVIAAMQLTTPALVSDALEQLFLRLAEGASRGSSAALQRLRMLHRAIIDREDQGESISRLLPGGLVEQMRDGGVTIGTTERLIVTVLMGDIRGYSTIAEKVDPTDLAAQLNEHRAAMNGAILGHEGTVMQFVGDAVMAVFGAPLPCVHHADRAVEAARAMHGAQAEINEAWERRGLPPFGLGIGISTGEVAAALLGSDERLEYTVVGDSVNLTQRLQQWAAAGETVLTESTWNALTVLLDAEQLESAQVKGRQTPVRAYKVAAAAPAAVAGAGG